MTQILAGLVGGLLALAGALGAQRMLAEIQRDDVARTLAARFLTELDVMYVLATKARAYYSNAPRLAAAEAVSAVEHIRQVDGTGNGLAMLVPMSVASPIRSAMNRATTLAFSVNPTNTDEQSWQDHLAAHAAGYNELETAFDIQFGPRRRTLRHPFRGVRA